MLFHLDSIAGIKSASIELGKNETQLKIQETIDRIQSHGPSRMLVLLLCSNNIATIISYIGCMITGNVPILISANSNKELISDICDIYKPNLIISSKNDNPDPIITKSHSKYLSLYEHLGLLMLTSGSTNAPKLIRLSYDNLRSNALAIIDYLNISSSEKPYIHLPIQYSYALSILNSHLLVGCELIITKNSPAQSSFWHDLRRFRCTSLSGVPSSYELYKQVGFFSRIPQSINTLTQAGGHLNKELVTYFSREAQRKGINFYVMYGQTEASPRISYASTETLLNNPKTIGKPIPGGTWWVEDLNGIKQDCNSKGRLFYSGANVMLGYSNCRQDLKKPDENNRILDTGDIAYLDMNGNAELIGRSSRIVKIHGTRVCLDELERALSEKNGTVYCVGDDNLIAICYLSSQTVTMDKKSIAKIINVHPTCIKIFSVAKIPITDSGKPNYNILKDIVDI